MSVCEDERPLTFLGKLEDALHCASGLPTEKLCHGTCCRASGPRALGRSPQGEKDTSTIHRNPRWEGKLHLRHEEQVKMNRRGYQRT